MCRSEQLSKQTDLKRLQIITNTEVLKMQLNTVNIYSSHYWDWQKKVQYLEVTQMIKYSRPIGYSKCHLIVTIIGTWWRCTQDTLSGLKVEQQLYFNSLLHSMQSHKLACSTVIRERDYMIINSNNTVQSATQKSSMQIKRQQFQQSIWHTFGLPNYQSNLLLIKFLFNPLTSIYISTNHFSRLY